MSIGNGGNNIGGNNGHYKGALLQEVPGLLDLYPNAAMAYSLRKLRAAYSGSAVRIRRSSDNTESNIGFLSNGNFNIAAAEAFCIAGGGSQNGFVTTWYDQSGNLKDWLQPTAAKQPQIINAGASILVNGKPSILFDGVNDGFDAVNPLLINDILSCFSVLKTASTTGLQYCDSSVNNKWFFILHSGSSSISISDRFSIATVAKNANIITPATRGDFYTEFGNNAQNLTYLRGQIAIANWANFSYMNHVGFELGGNSQEVIVYKSNKDTDQVAISNLINQYYGCY
jgi:hypothetical protein